MTKQQYRNQFESQVKDLVQQYTQIHGEAPSVTVEWGKGEPAAPEPGKWEKLNTEMDGALEKATDEDWDKIAAPTPATWEADGGVRELGVSTSPKAEDGDWKVIGHSYQIADTGDYDGHWEITNGKISILTKDDDNESLQEIVDFLNNYNIEFYQDDWFEFENKILKEVISDMKSVSTNKQEPAQPATPTPEVVPPQPVKHPGSEPPDDDRDVWVKLNDGKVYGGYWLPFIKWSVYYPDAEFLGEAEMIRPGHEVIEWWEIE